MGQKQSVFSKEELEKYEEVTFFTQKEILGVWERFSQLNPENKQTLTMEEVCKMKELSANPFKERICQVFSDDGSGNLTFEDFLDMLSVFSEGATRDVKASYAFRLYDFDGDEYIDRSDLIATLQLLTAGQLTEEEMNTITDKIMEESDLDGDERISYLEFEHVVARAPDFINTFRIRA
eukprot:Colp12_sorted_trinity150504_noHs@7647